MRRGAFMAGLIAALLSVQPLMAQPPKLKFQFRPQIQRPGKAPGIPLIPPSVAGRQALQGNPGAKLLGIRPLPNNGGYVVTLRNGGNVRRVIVPGN